MSLRCLTFQDLTQHYSNNIRIMTFNSLHYLTAEGTEMLCSVLLQLSNSKF